MNQQLCSSADLTHSHSGICVTTYIIINMCKLPIIPTNSIVFISAWYKGWGIHMHVESGVCLTGKQWCI